MGRGLSQLAAIPVSELRGVGPKKVESLESIGVSTVLDLLTYYPRRYIDRTRQLPINELTVGEEALIVVTVRRANVRRTRRGQAIVEIDVGDGSGTLRATFFNQAWRARQLPEGTTAVLFGKVDRYRGQRQMTNPVVDLIGNRTGKIVPIYPQSEKAGLSTWELAGWVEEALSRAGEFDEPVPDSWRDRLDLQDRTWAFRNVHEPSTMAASVAARRRLGFDELFRLQMTLVLRKKAVERAAKGVEHVTEGPLIDQFLGALPFPLTGAQMRANAEIAADLTSTIPMHRLLQGDVGSGKTLVAATALLVAVQGGHQGALMAPTEVLAEQHYAAFRSLLADLTIVEEGSLFGERPLAVELLTGRTPAADRNRLHAGLASGAIDILIGTHALLTEGVDFADLGVVVIDEQHRFGVEQRAVLRAKGTDPDVLVMTATPIPRTAAMTLYGDLDVTVLDEMPPGRTPVKTVWAPGPLGEEEAWGRVRAEIREGRQAYVVCPLVEDSVRIEARSAEEEHTRLSAEVFPDLQLGLVHGRLSSKDKDEVMSKFRAGDIDVLVATTVIEVGIDVPNATVMVIESADRFGIAQLHQLRGRVGRGADESWCYLLGGETAIAEGGDAEERMKAVAETTDGFLLAEVDLELRGEGAVLGTRQKGRSDLKLASLRRDKDLLLAAREAAFEVVESDPFLTDHPLLLKEVQSLITEEEAAFLFKS
ncbi:MAG TPA: ATP-dependent DNA helicase RecG [Acidimicrobiales bacterium]|nr:ATP-dependent DNA helicase RecG [Acidimicrobiales bacterium]